MKFTPIALALCAIAPIAASSQPSWTVDTQSEWTQAIENSTHIDLSDGKATPNAKTATIATKVKSFDQPRSADSLQLEQAPTWDNWNPTDNIGPSNLRDAPVFLAIGPNNYWIFGRYGNPNRNRADSEDSPFQPQAATLEGFDIPLQTTQFPDQYNAAGGLNPSLGGYHAWQSRDMKNWVHHGPVTENFSRWVTSAEYVDGSVYIYYDYPNDQDPHLYIDDNLYDGKPGKNMGIALRDPSHGSDCGVIRDRNGAFHIIIEDWSPINASQRAWDSPLAAHAVSPNGIDGFSFITPAVDNRTQATGEIATYKHPHWLQHPDWETNIAEYNVHEPEQEAYGDWASIAVGDQYYLFCDFDPADGGHMSVGRFTSSDLTQEFEWCGHIGNGHPDPDIGFANGQFYLITQQATDFVSPGPWVERVQVRVGADIDGDQKIDQWTDWTEVKETYEPTPGFAKQISKTPAMVTLAELPEAFGFQIEFAIEDTTENESTPVLDKLSLIFN